MPTGELQSNNQSNSRTIKPLRDFLQNNCLYPQDVILNKNDTCVGTTANGHGCKPPPYAYIADQGLFLKLFEDVSPEAIPCSQHSGCPADTGRRGIAKRVPLKEASWSG